MRVKILHVFAVETSSLTSNFFFPQRYVRGQHVVYVLNVIRGRGQNLREVGPNSLFREGGWKNVSERGMKLFFKGGGWVGERPINVSEIASDTVHNR